MINTFQLARFERSFEYFYIFSALENQLLRSGG